MIPEPVARQIAAETGGLDPEHSRPVGGGSINRCYRILNRDGCQYFLKVNHASALDTFEVERDGLQALQCARSVRVPEAIMCGVAGEWAFLLLENLDLQHKSSAAAARLGERLARQHRRTSDAFGWSKDNYIGSVCQENQWMSDWVAFFRDRRLRFQLELAARQGYGQALRQPGGALLERVETFFESYQPQPSLLHGDLWGGNWGAVERDEPVIFDPAVYYGDRETDLAMTSLFGGFDPEFYAAYDKAWSLDPGFEKRRDLYNLYHVLNHLNMFGSGYLHQALGLINGLLRRSNGGRRLT